MVTLTTKAVIGAAGFIGTDILIGAMATGAAIGLGAFFYMKYANDSSNKVAGAVGAVCGGVGLAAALAVSSAIGLAEVLAVAAVTGLVIKGLYDLSQKIMGSDVETEKGTVVSK